jgi:fatty acid desaturase
LTPLLPFSKKLREIVWGWMSSLAVILKYRRPLPTDKKTARDWLVQEWMAFLYGAAAVALVIAGVLPYTVLLVWYAVTAVSFFLNSLRTLAAHAYRNPGDRVMSQSDQVLDSVNVPGILFLPALWAPVGLRYHGTHHLFPIMPYHSLGKAHRRLMKGLKDNSLYLQTVRRSLWDALRRLWKETVANQSSGTA